MTVSSQVKQTLATLRGARGILRTYAAQSLEEEAINNFQEAVATISDILNDLESRIQTLEYEEPQYKGY